MSWTYLKTVSVNQAPDFLPSPNSKCQSAERNTKHWPQPVAWPYLFFVHQWAADRRLVALSVSHPRANCCYHVTSAAVTGHWGRGTFVNQWCHLSIVEPLHRCQLSMPKLMPIADGLTITEPWLGCRGKSSGLWAVFVTSALRQTSATCEYLYLCLCIQL